jgi:hypothetical protein
MQSDSSLDRVPVEKTTVDTINKSALKDNDLELAQDAGGKEMITHRYWFAMFQELDMHILDGRPFSASPSRESNSVVTKTDYCSR